MSRESQAVLECIEVGLRGALGESSEVATFYFLQTKGGLEAGTIPGDPHRFVHTLRTIFGLGSAVLLRSILKELHAVEAELGREGIVGQFADVLEKEIGLVESGIV